jgi:hypothetical protein
MNKQEYEAAIDATALRTDLDMLSGGDQTEIGEKVIFIYNLTKNSFYKCDGVCIYC